MAAKKRNKPRPRTLYIVRTRDSRGVRVVGMSVRKSDADWTFNRAARETDAYVMMEKVTLVRERSYQGD